MPFANPGNMRFGNGADEASSTEVGIVELTVTGGVKITRVSGYTGETPCTLSSASALRARLAVDVPRAVATPGHGFEEDVVETAADTDPERLEYRENGGKVAVKRAAGAEIAMLVDTAEGLRQALVSLGA